MNRARSFFSELQRRHVYKVGAMYAVAGWLLVQVVTQVFPIYDISTQVQRLFVGLVIAAFPVVLVLARIFDLTPAGLVRTEDLPPGGETASAVTQRCSADGRLNSLFGGWLVVPLGHVAAERAGTFGIQAAAVPGAAASGRLSRFRGDATVPGPI